jgi:hypothetical protein
MMQNRAIGELLRAKEVTSSDVETLLDTYLTAPTSKPLPLGPDHRVDVEAAIDAHRAAAKALTDPATTTVFRRTMIRTAILLAHAKKG